MQRGQQFPGLPVDGRVCLGRRPLGQLTWLIPRDQHMGVEVVGEQDGPAARPSVRPTVVRPDLARQVMVGRRPGLDDSLARTVAHAQHHGVHQAPAHVLDELDLTQGALHDGVLLGGEGRQGPVGHRASIGGSDPAASRRSSEVSRVGRMRIRPIAVGLAVLVVLGGGGLVLDNHVRAQTEAEIAANLRTQIPVLDSDPEVEIAGFPFLTQVAVGELERVDVTAPTATLENGLVLTDVVARLEGVSTVQPTTARTMHLEADIPMESVLALLDVPAQVTVENGAFVARARILVLDSEVRLVPRADGDRIAIDVDSLTVAGATVDADSLPGGIGDSLQGLTIPVDGLPEGLDLTRITLTPDVARIVADGQDVRLEEEG